MRLPLVLLVAVASADARSIRMSSPPRAYTPNALVPISLATARSVLGPNPTREQLAWHWGSTDRIFQKLSISWVGPLVYAYLNDVAFFNSFQATIMGGITASYFVWYPAFVSMSHGTGAVFRSSSAALFFGTVSSVVESTNDYDERIIELVIDDGTPEVQFVIGMRRRREHEKIQLGDSAQLIILLKGVGRSAEAEHVKECYLPQRELFFGNYPFLNREEFTNLVSRVRADLNLDDVAF
jgi:hypothetical protein